MMQSAPAFTSNCTVSAPVRPTINSKATLTEMNKGVGKFKDFGYHINIDITSQALGNIR